MRVLGCFKPQVGRYSFHVGLFHPLLQAGFNSALSACPCSVLNDLTSKRIVLVLDQLEQLSPHKHDAIFELIITQAQAQA